MACGRLYKLELYMRRRRDNCSATLGLKVVSEAISEHLICKIFMEKHIPSMCVLTHTHKLFPPPPPPIWNVFCCHCCIDGVPTLYWNQSTLTVPLYRDVYNNYWCWFQDQDNWCEWGEGEAADLGHGWTGAIQNHHINVRWIHLWCACCILWLQHKSV